MKQRCLLEMKNKFQIFRNKITKICLWKFSLFLFFGFFLVYLPSCQSPSESQYATKDRQFWKLLNKNPIDPSIAKSAFIYFFSTNQNKQVLKLFDKYENSLDILAKSDLNLSIYLATTMCIKAGISKNIENKLTWLRRGMIKFQELENKYPKNLNLMAWEAITYSNMPSILGLSSKILFNTSYIVNNLKEGGSPTIEEISLTFNACINSAKTYKEEHFITLAREIVKFSPAMNTLFNKTEIHSAEVSFHDK